MLKVNSPKLFEVANRYYKLKIRTNCGLFLLGLQIMISKLPKTLLCLLSLSYTGFAIGGGDTPSEDDVSTDSTALVGNSAAGEERYNKTCVNCHGPAGKGVASYPKVSGQEISYTTSKLETYREGTKIGPNSSLMIMMAKPLTDEEIANLAAYLKDATL